MRIVDGMLYHKDKVLGKSAKPELAADVAELTASKKQESYVPQYNRHVIVKTFSEGDTVLVFDDKRPGKMFFKWLRPYTLKGRYREHSYYKQSQEGRRLLMHANRLHPYV